MCEVAVDVSCPVSPKRALACGVGCTLAKGTTTQASVERSQVRREWCLGSLSTARVPLALGWCTCLGLPSAVGWLGPEV